MTRIITVTSGKGGVGKTNISVNMAIHLAAQGFKTCLFDADLGLANINILLGLYPEHNLEDVILENKNFEDILIKDCCGIDIIPGSSGVPRMADLAPDQITHLIESFSMLSAYDFLIFDTSAGVSKNVIAFCMASSEIILVVTPEPTSLTDGYSLLKILSLNGFSNPVMIVINQGKNVQIAGEIFTKLKKTVEKYLPINIFPIGTIVKDQHVTDAVSKQKAFLSIYPQSNASKCIKNITRQLIKKESTESGADSINTFWIRFMELLQGPLNTTGGKKRKKTISSNLEAKEKRKKQLHQAAAKKEQQSEEVDISSSREKARVLEVTEKDNLAQETHFLLSRLVENTSAISKELGAIRRALEK